MRTAPARVITGIVNADGSTFSGGGFTTRKSATGTYGVSLPTGQRLLGLTANPKGTAIGTSTTSLNDTGATVIALNTSGAAVDAPFNFVAVVAA